MPTGNAENALEAIGDQHGVMLGIMLGTDADGQERGAASHAPTVE